jgi:RNA polymerase sigma-70 factor (ECF subfamily)
VEPADDITRTLQLLSSAQDGDEAALNRLIDRYYERVRRVVRLRIGARLRSKVDSGDILQETFIAALNCFDRFEVKNEASFINWLSKIAERQIMAAADHFGAQKRDAAKEVPLKFGDESGPIGVDPAASELPPLQKLSEQEQLLALESAIAELPEQYRELIILRDYTGASWEDVAEQTGRPSAAAARMMHAKALIELGKLMTGARGQHQDGG